MEGCCFGIRIVLAEPQTEISFQGNGPGPAEAIMQRRKGDKPWKCLTSCVITGLRRSA